MINRARLRRQEAKRDAWNAEARKRIAFNWDGIDWDAVHHQLKMEMDVYDAAPKWLRDHIKEIG